MQVVVLLLLVAGLALLVLGLMTGSTPLVAASIAASLLAAYVISRVRRQVGVAGTATALVSAPEKARVSAPAAVMAGAPASAPERPAYADAPAEPANVVVRPADTGVRPGSTGSDQAETGPEGVVTASAVTAPAVTAPAEPAPAVTAPAVTASAEPTPAVTAPAVTASAEPEPAESAATGPDPAGNVDSDDPATPEPAVADTDPPLRSRGDESVWVIDGRPRYHLSHCGFLLGRQPEPVPLRQAVEDGFSPCALCDPDTGLAASRS